MQIVFAVTLMHGACNSQPLYLSNNYNVSFKTKLINTANYLCSRNQCMFHTFIQASLINFNYTFFRFNCTVFVLVPALCY